MMHRLFRTFLGAIVAIMAGTLAIAHADPVEDFYANREITMLLSTDAGGGYASYAIAFAPYLRAHVPGNPTVIVDYMPGAGGLRAMNYLYTNARKDGSVIGLVHSSVPFAPLYGIEAAKFDPRQMNWLGSLATAFGICVAWHESDIRTWEDFYDKEYFVGSSGAGSQMETIPMMLNNLFGTNIKVISGYKGGNEVYHAMERGEVDGRCGGLVSSISSTRPDWFTENKVSIPIQIALERNPMFPDAPALGEFVKDELTRQVLELILSPMAMDRPVLAPPGVPADRLAALKAAFHAAMNDPGFIADAERLKIRIDEVDGERVADILASAFELPPEVVEAANKAMNLSGGTGGSGY